LNLTKIGRYQILGELGRGAMGVVYRAHDPNIGREVAIKTIHLDKQEAEAVERFRREAKAAGNLSHPNIITIYDAGEDKGVFYIAMELLSGETLQQILAKGAMRVGEMIRIIEQVSAALDYAHARHVVHRDIKPANIMISGGHVKVMDFGVAKIASTMATATNRVVGTPSYMSPEQIGGGAIDGRSDIFSMGAMLYEMAAGTRPFRGENIAAVMFQIMRADPAPLTDVNPSIPSGLNAVVRKALAKEPIARYQTGSELIADLRSFEALGTKESVQSVKASGASVGVRPAGSGEEPVSPDTRVETMLAGAVPEAGRREPGPSLWKQRKALVLAGAGVVLLLIAGLANWPTGTGRESAPSAGDLAVEPAPATAPLRPQAQQPEPSAATAPAVRDASPSPAPTPPAAPASPPGAVGRVSVHTEPQGARILVDDKETSYRTPVNFGLTPGTYQIRVELPGYDSQTKEIVVRQNETVTGQFELQRSGEGRSLLPLR
jgi:serine/threonine-protein kinase